MSHIHCHHTHHNPFRADQVGSFLRPARLAVAREQFAEGVLSREALTQIEDELIHQLVDKQIEVGLKGITDGEFRRAYWHLDFFWGLNGIEHTQAKTGYQFHDETTKADSADVVGPISGDNHPFVQHFIFLKEVVGDRAVPRQTIPAPAQLYFELIRDAEHIAQTFSVYPSKEQLFADIAAAYRQVIDDLYAAGCRNLQLDDCTWGAIVDDNLMELIAKGANNSQTPATIRQELAQDFLTVNNAILQNLPSDLVVNTHVCRGNFHSTWAASGGYQPIAQTLFGQEDVSAYYLEYDTDRAGDFAPLSEIPEGKKVVLGLITSKSGQLEERQTIIDRIHEAAQYVPLERLYLSPQCGFASTEEGNILTEEEQWKKLAFVNSIAQEIWPDA